jgi:hypothetical protein
MEPWNPGTLEQWNSGTNFWNLEFGIWIYPIFAANFEKCPWRIKRSEK